MEALLLIPEDVSADDAAVKAILERALERARRREEREDQVPGVHPLAVRRRIPDRRAEAKLCR